MSEWAEPIFYVGGEKSPALGEHGFSLEELKAENIWLCHLSPLFQISMFIYNTGTRMRVDPGNFVSGGVVIPSDIWMDEQILGRKSC